LLAELWVCHSLKEGCVFGNEAADEGSMGGIGMW
jgi:hypothetical protein